MLFRTYSFTSDEAMDHTVLIGIINYEYYYIFLTSYSHPVDHLIYNNYSVSFNEPIKENGPYKSAYIIWDTIKLYKLKY